MLLRALAQRECQGWSRSNKPARSGYRVKESPFSGHWNEERCCKEGLVKRFRLECDEFVSVEFLPTVAKFPKKINGCPSSERSVVAVGDEYGAVSLYKQNGDECEMLDQIIAQQNAVFDITWMDANTKLASGAGDRVVRVFDIETKTTLHTFGKHNSSVRCVRTFHNNPNILVSCCRGGMACLWDTRAGRQEEEGIEKPVLRVEGLHFSCFQSGKSPKRGTGSNMTCIQPTRDDCLLATSGANDGLVKFWDCRNVSNNRLGPVPVQTIEVPKEATHGRERPGISCTSFSNDGTKLLVNYRGADIVVYDWLKYSSAQWQERSRILTSSDEFPYSCPSFYIQSSFSPDDEYVVSGSGNGTLYLWGILDRFGTEPVGALNGHEEEAGSVDWDPNNFGRIVSTGDDGNLMFWGVGSSPLDSEVEEEEREIEEGLISPPFSPESQNSDNISLGNIFAVSQPSVRIERKKGVPLFSPLPKDCAKPSRFNEGAVLFADQDASDLEMDALSEETKEGKRGRILTLHDFWQSEKVESSRKRQCQ